MYVYFDSIGDIKSISPIEDLSFGGDFKVASFSLDDVEDFLTAKESTFNFYVKLSDATDADVYTIERKYVPKINYIRSSSTFLDEVKPLRDYDIAAVLIHNSIKSKIITISLSSVIDYDVRNTSPAATEFLQTPTVSMFFTKKHDPYFLLYTVSVVPASLMGGNSVSIPYEENLSNVSVYVNSFKGSYSYSETD